MSEVRFMDRPVFYRRREGTSDRAIMYLHGLGCSSADFTEISFRPEFKDDTLVAFDFPGCGNSPYPEEGTLTIDNLVEVTERVVQHMELGRFVLLAHSMGGAVGLRYLENRFNSAPTSNQVTAFVSVEGNLAGDTHPVAADDCFLSRSVSRQNVEKFCREGFSALIMQMDESPNIGLRAYGQSLRRASPQAYHDLSTSLVAHSDTGDLLRIFTDIALPRAFIYGGANRGGLKGLFPAMRRSGIKVLEVPQSDHFPGYDNPGAFYQKLSKFLDRIS